MINYKLIFLKEYTYTEQSNAFTFCSLPIQNFVTKSLKWFEAPLKQLKKGGLLCVRHPFIYLSQRNSVTLQTHFVLSQ